MLLKLAWRNLWRRKRRSLITALSIAFATWVAVAFQSIGNDSYTRMIDNGATMGFGHVAVLPKNYIENPSLKKYVAGIAERIQVASSHPGVKKVSTRILGNAVVATANRNIPAQFVAIDPGQEDPQDNVFIRKIVEGEMFSTRDSRHVAIGHKMAKKLKLKLGKKIVYTTTDVHGDMTSQLLRVKAIFNTGADEIDDFMIVIPIDSAREALGYSKDQATVVSLFLKDQRRSAKIRDELQTKLKMDENSVLLTWKESNAELAGFVAVDRGGNQFLIILIACLCALGVLNTMLMGVMERQREFGIMLALGMPRKILIGGILLESLFISLVGLIIGAILFAPTHYLMITKGIDFSELMDGASSAGGSVMEPVIHSVVFTSDVVAVAISLIILTMLASLYPAIKASQMQPVEAIKELS